MTDQAESVLHFWFEEVEASSRFIVDFELDAEIRQRFGALHRAVAAGECYAWRRSPRGRLAEIIVLDQFSRNLYRDAPQAFACDGMALVLAQEAVAAGADQELAQIERNFLYMPYMHSESVAIHREAERLFRANGDPVSLDFEIKHQELIERFGRYPHRNAALGRTSSAEELAFLAEQGRGF